MAHQGIPAMTSLGLQDSIRLRHENVELRRWQCGRDQRENHARERGMQSALMQENPKDNSENCVR